MSFLPVYVCPLRHEALKIQLSSKARYLVPLPPMSEDVEEEGSLLGYANDLNSLILLVFVLLDEFSLKTKDLICKY